MLRVVICIHYFKTGLKVFFQNVWHLQQLPMNSSWFKCSWKETDWQRQQLFISRKKHQQLKLVKALAKCHLKRRDGGLVPVGCLILQGLLEKASFVHMLFMSQSIKSWNGVWFALLAVGQLGSKSENTITLEWKGLHLPGG